MSKVIRISTDIFGRLQQLAEPLVDTPASVIERLLDYYQEHSQDEKIMDNNLVTEPVSAHATTRQENLFLAPATAENVQATIQKGVRLATAEQYLSRNQIDKLRNALGSRESFNCWAMTESNRSTFKAMQYGDTVLLSIKGTNQFNFKGTVLTTIESGSLGNNLWSVTPRLPWNLIYVLDGVEQISCSKSKIVSALGYKSNYAVPGVIRVDPRRLQKVISSYGSIRAFLDAMGA